MTKQANTDAAAPAGFKTVRPGVIYMIRDQFESATGRITAAHLPAIAEQLGCHPTTVRLQFYRWRKASDTAAAKMARGEAV